MGEGVQGGRLTRSMADAWEWRITSIDFDLLYALED